MQIVVPSGKWNFKQDRHELFSYDHIQSVPQLVTRSNSFLLKHRLKDDRDYTVQVFLLRFHVDTEHV